MIVGGGRRLLRWIIIVAVVLLFAVAVRQALLALYPYAYRDSIQAAGERYDIDPLLLAAVIHTESRFRPNAVSAQGAMGLMQLLPATARDLAGPSFQAKDLFQPEVNVDLGAHYLANLSASFDGHLSAALAAYNGGQTNVRKWLSEGQWDGTAADAGNIPFAETREFVQRVYRAERLYRWLYDGQ